MMSGLQVFGRRSPLEVSASVTLLSNLVLRLGAAFTMYATLLQLIVTRSYKTFPSPIPCLPLNFTIRLNKTEST